jgi:hypothetical protein
MKKILPKNTTAAPSAEALEASFQKSASVKTESSITHHPLPKKTLMSDSVATAEGIKNTPMSKREGRSRISIDIPDALYAQIENHKEETGQTMTHLVVSLLKKFLAEKTNNNN